MTDASKLAELCEIEGLSEHDMLEHAVKHSVCPAICMNAVCDYSEEMEPDQDRGWCDWCGTNSMKSALILAGLI